MFHQRRPRPPCRHRLQPGQEAALVLKLAPNNSPHTCTCGSAQGVLFRCPARRCPNLQQPCRSEIRGLSATSSAIFKLLLTLVCFTINTSVRQQQFSPVMTVISLWDKLEATPESRDVNNTFLFLVCDAQAAIVPPCCKTFLTLLLWNERLQIVYI